MQNLGEWATNANAENQQLLNLLPIPIAILTGEQHHITFANDAMFNFWRRDGSEYTIGRPVAAAFPELDFSYLVQLSQVMQSGITYKDEEVLLTLNDQPGDPYSIYIDYTYQPILDVQSKVTGVLVTAQDVSHKVSAKKALQEASAKLEDANCALKASNDDCLMAIETAKLGTWKLNLVNGQFKVTERTLEICGATGDISSLSEFLALVHQDYKKDVEAAFLDSADHHTNLDLEFPVSSESDSSDRWIRLSGKSSQASQGSDKMMSGTILDITDQKMQVIRKNQFIGMVSHELKTPLTSLTGMIQLIGRKVDADADAQLQNILDKSLHQVSKMTYMINSFVNISRLESGKFELQETTFDMEELIAEYLSEAQMTSPHHHFIQHDCEAVYLNADRIKIGAVLANMVSNAVKYSLQGSHITISCRQLDAQLEVSVKDQGCGIAESDKNRVFERFSHIHNAHVKNASGFGIGLYLCAEIIRHHHGEIWVENNPDAGCTFYFRLPVNR